MIFMNNYNVQLIPDAGYEQAISYYHALKIHFMKNIVNISENQIKNNFLQNAKRFPGQMFSAVGKTETAVKEKFFKDVQKIAEKLFGDGTALKATIEQIKQDNQKTEEEKKAMVDKLRIDAQKSIIAELQKLQNYNLHLTNVIKRSSQIGSSEAIEKLYTTYLSSLVLNELQIFSSYINRPAIAGYFQEIAEANAMKQFFTNLGGQVQHAGELKGTSGKETPIDIAIGKKGAKNIGKQTIAQYETLLEKLSNFEVEGVVENSFESLFSQLNITSVGAQSKLASITSARSKKLGFNIGSRNELLQQFLSSSYDFKSQLVSAHFFGKSMTAIVKSLGPNNLFFITGTQRYFMDDFIKEFRKENFYLAFNYHNKKLTSTVN